MRRALLASSIGLAVYSSAALAHATTYDIHPGDALFTTLQGLAAGDTVVIHAGTYVTPGFLAVTWPGTAAQPIVVKGADGELPVIQGDMSQNVLNVKGSYFTIENLEIVGGSHGIRLDASDHGTLRDLKLHGLGDVGISCNFDGITCDAMTIAHNEIFDTGHSGTGEGMYLGCNDALCTFSNSIVEGNYVHDLGGSQGDGIEVKTGAFGNVIRDNVIVRSQYPGITMYGFAGGGAPNVVERNLVWTTQDNGIQIVGQIVVRNNIVIGAAGNGIQSKASQGFSPDGAIVEHNTVWGAGAACFKSNDWATSTGQVLANNAFYCLGGTAIDLNGGAPGATVVGNVVLGGSNAPGGVVMGVSDAADLGAPMAAQVYPPAGSALLGAGDAAHAAMNDFNGTPRSAPFDAGAYQRTSDANPGWMPGEGFKGTTSGAGGAGATASVGAGPGASTGTGAGATSGAGGASAGGGGSGNGASSSSGCGCAIPSEERTSEGGLLAALALGALVARRRRAPS
jgi:MYXO-CTERM domain-containing protein